MSHILLSGGSGVVGSSILARLLKDGHEVMTLTREPTILGDFAPEVLIHAAWEGSDSARRNDTELLARNITMSMGLLELAAKAGTTRFIGFGSQAEYSLGLSEPISETSPAEPISAYGRAKLELGRRQLEFCASHGMQGYWLRLFTCYSARQKLPYLIPYLRECRRTGDTPKLATPQAVEDFLHADDAASAVAALLASEAEPGVYNVASGIGISVGEVARYFGFDMPEHPGAGTRRVANIHKFSQACDWNPAIALKDAIAQMVE